MAATNLTMTGDFHISPREIDFVTRFERNWNHLRTILGVMRPIKKNPGTTLKSYSASVTLQSGAVGEGEVIPYSKATVTETPYVELAFEKFAKGVTLESIDKFGKARAIDLTDTEFINELQQYVTNRFYAYLQTGTLREHQSTFQAALANAYAAVLDKWRSMHRTSTGIVGFANLRDAYRWMGEATIGAQIKNDAGNTGLQYLENYLGLSPLILLSSNELPFGKVIATPRENIVLYYADPSASDFSDAGFEFTTGRGQTNLIGIHSKPNYETMVADLHAVMAMEMFAEYQDGIAVVTFGAAPDAASARLVSLSVGTLPLTPAFDPDVTSYTAATTNATNIIRATPEIGTATVAIANGATAVTNGSAATWADGSNTLTATVTNGTGESATTKTYTVTVTKN